MPNGHDLVNQLDFQEHFRGLSPDDKLLFIGQQVYTMNQRCADHSQVLDKHETKITKIEESCRGCDTTPVNSRKQVVTNSISGGVTGAIVGIIIALVEYFRK